jgi:hypothetical protein
MVRIKEWKKNGKKGLEVDIRITLADGTRVRERVKSPVSSKSGTVRWAQQREAEILARGGCEEAAAPAPVPTVAAFAEKFLTYSETNNKPSTVYAKRWMLRTHLIPSFGDTRLDKIGPAEIESYKAKKLAQGLDKKSINNHLTALRKMLNLAVEWASSTRLRR